MQTDDLEVRRRRCLFRAQHRGTKEMDWLLGRFAEARLQSADASELAMWERLVQVADPLLYDWIVNGAAVEDAEFAAVIRGIQLTNGLSTR